jgi:hypothetical protein
MQVLHFQFWLSARIVLIDELSTHDCVMKSEQSVSGSNNQYFINTGWSDRQNT